MRSTVDEVISQMAETYASGVSQIASHAVLRDGLARAALNEVIWALYRAFPENDEAIAEHLDLMGDLVREQARERDSARR